MTLVRALAPPQNTQPRWVFFLIFAVLALFILTTPALAQIVSPPIVHWIGPDVGTEESPGPCDYKTIQEAMEKIFDCGNFPCPLERNELRLTSDYQHNGQITISRTVDIVGGFDHCQGIGSFNQHPLSGDPAQPLIVIAPGTRSIENVLSRLSLEGGAGLSSRGGVIRMETGAAKLTLRDSTVSDGNADDGGGIYLSGDGNRLNIVNSQINASQSLRGGGIFCTNAGTVDFQSGVIQGNTALQAGGGIYLEGECRLLGNTAGVDRRIVLNEVTDTQAGEGGGIYALDSLIKMGAPLSRTMIDDNSVQWLPLHNYEQPGQNNGGGVHLESTEAFFHNTWFRGNAAADGGAISVSGRTFMLVDRFSGPCKEGPDNNPERCSVFEFNRARGGTDDGGDEGGDGSVLLSRNRGGFSPITYIYRSTLRSNVAGCYEADEADLEGECDIGIQDRTYQSMITKADRLVGNLIYGNSIGDDNDSEFPIRIKEGQYFGNIGLFAENTVTQNVDADGLFRASPIHLMNNIIWDLAPDSGVDGFDLGPVDISSCNVSNFADQFDGLATTVNIPTVNQIPEFVNDGIGGSEDFRLKAPQSPALDRCDDEGGFLMLAYDIVGTPRNLDLNGSANGSGERDAGAFEVQPLGYIDESADLAVLIESATPSRAEQGQSHSFSISVRNVGKNPVESLRLQVSPLELGNIESLTGAQGFDPNTGGLIAIWDCNPESLGLCRYLPSTLPVGATTSTVTAEISHQSTGSKSVRANVVLLDPTLSDINSQNDEAEAEVTVGPGADLQLILGRPEGQVISDQVATLGIYVINRGLIAAENVRIQIDLSAANAQLISASAPDWVCNLSTGSCEMTTPLRETDPPQQLALEVQFANPGQKTLSATISSSQGDPNLNNNTDVSIFEVITLQDTLFHDSFEVSGT